MSVAAALRLWGISDRLPDPSLGINPFDDSAIEETDRTTMGLAWSMWVGGAKPLDLNPHTGGWPGLSFYLTLVIQVIYRGYAELFLGVSGSAAFIQHVSTYPDQFFLFGRFFGLALGLLTVWLTYRLGHQLVGRTPALIAAALLAVSPLHIGASQHISDPNLLALLFTLLAISWIVRVAVDRCLRTSALSGAMIGLAAASKYVPLLLAIPLVYAHLAWWRSSSRGRAPSARSCAVSLLSALAAFVAASPYVLVDHPVAWGEIMLQASTLTSDWTGQTTLPLSLPTYLTKTLPTILGWPVLMLSIIGMATFWIRSLALRAVALAVLSLLIGNGLLRVAQERYLLPTLPLLLIASGFATNWIRQGLASRIGVKPAGLATTVLIGVIAAQALLTVSKTRAALGYPDTRHESRRWLNARIAPHEPLVVELYGPVVNSDATERLAIAWPFFAAAPERVRAAYDPVFLDGFRYYVSSSEVSGRFEQQPRKYPVEGAHYRWLATNGNVVWRSDSLRASGPRILILEIPAHVSTRAERDSAWSRALTRPIDRPRLSAWCWDLSQMFLLGAQDIRAEEWAERGLSVAAPDRQVGFIRSIAAARLNLGDFRRAEAASAKGLAMLSSDAVLHHYRGRALEGLARDAEAATEYDLSLRFAPAQSERDAIRAAIRRIRSRQGKGLQAQPDPRSQ